MKLLRLSETFILKHTNIENGDKSILKLTLLRPQPETMEKVNLQGENGGELHNV